MSILLAQVGNFAQIPNEYLEKLLQFGLGKNEWQIVIFFMRQIIGWKMFYRPFSTEQLISGTGLAKDKLFLAMGGLVEKKVIDKKKLKGFRSCLYGFDQNTFGRILIGEAMKTWEENSKVLDLETFRVSKKQTLKVSNSDTFKNRRSATSADTQFPKYTRNTVLNISLKELMDFMGAQPRATKSRWERFILETLKANPEDQRALWTAIELVHRTKKDFLGNPIRSSIIGLFENTEWVLVKEAMLTSLRKEKEREESLKRQREQEELLQKAREQELLSINPETIGPAFQKYLKMGKNE